MFPEEFGPVLAQAGLFHGLIVLLNFQKNEQMTLMVFQILNKLVPLRIDT